MESLGLFEQIKRIADALSAKPPVRPKTCRECRWWQNSWCYGEPRILMRDDITPACRHGEQREEGES